MISIVDNCSDWVRGTKLHPHRPQHLIRANMGCAVATIDSNLAFFFFVRLHGQPEPFGSCIIPHLRFLLATIFSRFRFLSNSLSSPLFNLLRVARSCFLWFFVFFFPHLILGLSFLYSSVSDALFAQLLIYKATLARCSFSWFSVFFFLILILLLSFLCSSVSDALFAQLLIY